MVLRIVPSDDLQRFIFIALLSRRSLPRKPYGRQKSSKRNKNLKSHEFNFLVVSSNVESSRKAKYLKADTLDVWNLLVLAIIIMK